MNADDDKCCYWSLFQTNFINIIKTHPYYKNIFKFLQETQNNALLFGAHGFPTDLFIDEVIKHKFSINQIYKKECIWNKDIVYYANQHFLEINLMHPSMPKDMSVITKFIISVIKNKNINDDKHFIIIKHIDLLNTKDFNCFRIILERFSNNVYFLCTTHKLDKIDVPVKSRFALFRMPLFTHDEILCIFKEYLSIPLNKYLAESKTRNVIKAIYIANCKDSLCTKDFCSLNFPPIFEFYKNIKKQRIEDFRNFAYKCFQYNIGISELLCDLLKLLPNKKKSHAIHIASEIDDILQKTNKGRESIYIESFLCQVLL
jgi:DNA polymerase III delta prime subunit